VYTWQMYRPGDRLLEGTMEHVRADRAEVLVHKILGKVIHMTSKSRKRRLNAQGIRIVSTQARIGPIPGCGIVLLVDRETYKDIKVGDKVMPELEEVVYEVKSIEMSDHGSSIGLVVGRPINASGVSVMPPEKETM